MRHSPASSPSACFSQRFSSLKLMTPNAAVLGEATAERPCPVPCQFPATLVSRRKPAWLEKLVRLALPWLLVLDRARQVRAADFIGFLDLGNEQSSSPRDFAVGLAG